MLKMGWLKEKREERLIRQMYERIDGQHIAYATMRMPDCSEKVLGKEGSVNLVDGEILVRVGDRYVFRGDLDQVQLGELTSLNGITVKGFDKESGTERSVIAYYVYYRK